MAARDTLTARAGELIVVSVSGVARSVRVRVSLRFKLSDSESESRLALARASGARRGVTVALTVPVPVSVPARARAAAPIICSIFFITSPLALSSARTPARSSASLADMTASVGRHAASTRAMDGMSIPAISASSANFKK